MGFSAFAVDDTATEATPIAWICIQAGSDTQWHPAGADNRDEETENAIGSAVELTGDDKYTASVTMANGSSTVELLSLETTLNACAYAPEGTDDLIVNSRIKITIESIEVVHASGDTTKLDYIGPSTGAFRTSNDGSSICYNIWNTRTSPKVRDIQSESKSSFEPEGGLAGGDTINIVFTITGMDAPEVSKGDVDGDGDITIDDAFKVLQEYSYIAAGRGASFTDEEKGAANVDGDGDVTLDDAFAILSYYSAKAAGKDVNPNDFFGK
ncbi:hypothetical protein [uncultured Ruminococcus sp.]|uniref:hypothetical protein n=1 Tax=uncultured Ruminococcus sp. TaxID=165186 RepID=UPI00265ED1D5|nr:hypothetical protein [uncultured Ruminococcus sp.]